MFVAYLRTKSMQFHTTGTYSKQKEKENNGTENKIFGVNIYDRVSPSYEERRAFNVSLPVNFVWSLKFLVDPNFLVALHWNGIGTERASCAC